MTKPHQVNDQAEIRNGKTNPTRCTRCTDLEELRNHRQHRPPTPHCAGTANEPRKTEVGPNCDLSPIGTALQLRYIHTALRGSKRRNPRQTPICGGLGQGETLCTEHLRLPR